VLEAACLISEALVPKDLTGTTASRAIAIFVPANSPSDPFALAEGIYLAIADYSSK
jgi:hypothetical protein